MELPKNKEDLKKRETLIFDNLRLEIYIKRNEELEKRVKQLEEQQRQILSWLQNFVQHDFLKQNYHNKNEINNFRQENINYLTNNYYNKDYMEENYYKKTEIDNMINQLNQQMAEINNINISIQELQQQGKNNTTLIEQYNAKIADAMLLCRKNLKVQNVDKIMNSKHPQRMFAFLFNNMMGLQLERKLKELKGRQPGKIEDEISKRINADCQNIGLKAEQQTLNDMIELSKTIYKNHMNKSTSDMYQENSDACSEIQKQLREANKKYQINDEILKINNNESSLDDLLSRLKKI